MRLRIAGSWSESDTRDEALAFIAEKNLSGRIDFAGSVDAASKRDFLASGTLFLIWEIAAGVMLWRRAPTPA